MRTLQVVECFGAGVYEVVRALSSGLADRGHEVAIAYGVRPETPADLRAVVDSRVELVRMPWHRRAPAEQLAAARRLRELDDDWRPDVVHLHSSFAGFTGAAVLRGRRPLVHSPHGYAFLRTDIPRAQRRAFVAAERFISHHVDLVGAVSQGEAELARRVTGARRVVVVPNGVGTAASSQRAREPLDPLVVASGRIGPARRPEASARILGQVRDLAAVTWLGGGDAVTEAAVRRQGVEVTGWLAHDELLSRLREASACLHWSEWDSHPLAVLEAMTIGVPVIASDIPANRELLGPEQVRRTEAEATALLRHYLEDPDARAEAVHRQTRRCALFTPVAMAEGWERAYAGLICSAAATEERP